MENNRSPKTPLPCTAGCGFYGNEIYNNMCSKCFNTHKPSNQSKQWGVTWVSQLNKDS
ncbi:hypothetical protein BDF14DRAFT_1753951 [Spinellus fusiger]|nr:hypothetical protein BDF14DRAFT_1753951 [Spinellus fusiger]